MSLACRGATARRLRATPLLAGSVVLLALLGCGDTTSQQSWVPSHSDTALLSFQTTAPGVCAITVQYPKDAPAAIVYQGGTYVQIVRKVRPTSPAGRRLGQPGDWQIFVQAGGDLLLVTAHDASNYRFEV